MYMIMGEQLRSELQTSGSAAAPKGDRTDTPTGTRLSGRPSLVISYCASCHFGAPFPRRSPCPRCGYDPHSLTGNPHLLREAVWMSKTVWWNPITWGSGYWATKPLEAEIDEVRFRLDVERAFLLRMEQKTQEVREEIQRLECRLRDLVRVVP